MAEMPPHPHDAWVRAQYEVVIDARKQIPYQATANANWFIASSLTVNAGGIATCASFLDKLGLAWLPAAAFITGLFLVAIAAYFQSRLQRVVIASVNLLMEYFGRRLHHDEVNDELWQASQTWDASISLESRRFQFTIFASLGVFLLGVFLVPVAFAAQPHFRSPICARIQSDLLSAHPRRTDDLELLKYLNCPIDKKATIDFPRTAPGPDAKMGAPSSSDL